MDILETVLHYWPIIWGVGGAFVGWCVKALVDYHKKDVADHDTLTKLAQEVKDMRSDLDAIKAGNVAEYQESIASAHRRYVTDHDPLTIASRGRINAMMRSLSALDDEDGTFQAMVDDINDVPIYQPHEG